MVKHVLIIEDEPNIVEALSFILSRDGWAVSLHADGNDAVEAVQRKRLKLLRQLASAAKSCYRYSGFKSRLHAF